MKRASYRHAVALIALNDGAGDGPGYADNTKHVSGMVSVGIVADLFGVPTERLAADVVRYRAREDASEESEP